MLYEHRKHKHRPKDKTSDTISTKVKTHTERLLTLKLTVPVDMTSYNITIISYRELIHGKNKKKKKQCEGGCCSSPRSFIFQIR